jgi:uncharacterized protein DUF4331
MRRLAFVLLVAAASAALLVALASRGGSPSAAQASSHREAPLISEDPSADNTDTYAFRSPDRPDTVTIIANYIPGEDPAAGPNWYGFSPSARYVVYADKNGDGGSASRTVHPSRSCRTRSRSTPSRASTEARRGRSVRACSHRPTTSGPDRRRTTTHSRWQASTT